LQGCVAVAIEDGVEAGGVEASCGGECVDHVCLLSGKSNAVVLENVAGEFCIYQPKKPGDRV
jgi:hypothetical protein